MWPCLGKHNFQLEAFRSQIKRSNHTALGLYLAVVASQLGSLLGWHPAESTCKGLCFQLFL